MAIFGIGSPAGATFIDQMELTAFIQDLVARGRVSVYGALAHCEAGDVQAATTVLRQFYEEDVLDMPAGAPAFADAAASWAAQYFYVAVRLTVVRDAGEEVIRSSLPVFNGDQSPENIYSADLVLRHLPALLELAKGLAPADLLVQELLKTAAQWPFSSVGASLAEPVQDDFIFLHPWLRQVYMDRVMTQQDKKRLHHPGAGACLREIAGDYLPLLWPQLEPDKYV